MERSDRRTALVGQSWAWQVLGRLGAAVIESAGGVLYLTSLICAVLALCIRPSRWRRTSRKVFARQLLGIGVNTIVPLGLVAFLVGILIVIYLVKEGYENFTEEEEE